MWTLLIQCSQQHQESTKSMEARKESTRHSLLPQYRSEVCVFWPGQLYWLRCNKGSQCTHGNFSSERFLACLGQESLQNWAFGKNKNSIIYNIICICVCIYYITLYCHPKSKRAEPHSILLLGVLLKDQFPPTWSLGAMRQGLAASQGKLRPPWHFCCWRSTSGTESSLLWEQLWRALAHQPSTTSSPPGTPPHKKTFPGCATHWHRGCSSQCSGTSERWGKNSPCPLSSGFAWQLQSLLSTRNIWAVLVSARGR